MTTAPCAACSIGSLLLSWGASSSSNCRVWRSAHLWGQARPRSRSPNHRSRQATRSRIDSTGSISSSLTLAAIPCQGSSARSPRARARLATRWPTRRDRSTVATSPPPRPVRSRFWSCRLDPCSSARLRVGLSRLRNGPASSEWHTRAKEGLGGRGQAMGRLRQSARESLPRHGHIARPCHRARLEVGSGGIFRLRASKKGSKHGAPDTRRGEAPCATQTPFASPSSWTPRRP